MSCCHSAHETACGLKYVAFNRASCPLSITHRLTFHDDGVSFVTIEHYLAFKKAAHAGKAELCEKVLKTRDPALARTLVRCIPRLEAWNEEETMKRGLCLKFDQNPSARVHLCSTRDAVLVSTYPVGCLWGVRKMSEYDARLTDTATWQGDNRLGELLADLRHRFRVEKERKHKELELKRADSFYDLAIDDQLGKFCDPLQLEGATTDEEEDDSDIETPAAIHGCDIDIFEHGPACTFCDTSSAFEFA